ncbi:MAG TPA: nucleotidyl transferase AbiEii/AbiGii toxin family protein [Acidobacteriota bacterium]
MPAPTSRLTRLQRDILQAFFKREQGFFLTGGAALAGFHLGHRETHDLDLFTNAGPLDAGVAALRSAARELGATCEETRTAPDFRRFLLARGGESVVVDLVLDRTPQLAGDKPRVGSIRVDPPEEIFANKLCTLLGRAEIRDLVDARALEATGLSLEQAVEGGRRKDGGLTPGQLAWVLSQIDIGDDARIPGGVPAPELRDYLRRLIDRLAVLARPRSP